MISNDNFAAYNAKVQYLNNQLQQYEKVAKLIDEFITRPNNEFNDVDFELQAAFQYTRFANVKDDEPVKNENIYIDLNEIKHFKKFFDDRVYDIKSKLIVLYNQSSVMDPFGTY
jgi:predicted GH43/DUF377 family glycosyl hydrolase